MHSYNDVPYPPMSLPQSNYFLLRKYFLTKVYRFTVYFSIQWALPTNSGEFQQLLKFSQRKWG